MKVQVKLFASLAQQVRQRTQPPEHAPDRAELRAGQPFQLELPPGSCVAELITQIELPAEEVKVVFVNARARRFDHPLADGDQVGIFPLVGGG